MRAFKVIGLTLTGVLALVPLAVVLANPIPSRTTTRHNLVRSNALNAKSNALNAIAKRTADCAAGVSVDPASYQVGIAPSPANIAGEGRSAGENDRITVTNSISRLYKQSGQTVQQGEGQNAAESEALNTSGTLAPCLSCPDSDPSFTAAPSGNSGWIQVDNRSLAGWSSSGTSSGSGPSIVALFVFSGPSAVPSDVPNKSYLPPPLYRASCEPNRGLGRGATRRLAGVGSQQSNGSRSSMSRALNPTPDSNLVEQRAHSAIAEAGEFGNPMRTTAAGHSQ